MSLDFFTEFEIRDDIDRIESIVGSGIFSSDNSSSPLVRSAFTETMVCLRDLLYKAEKYSARISFTDEILTTDTVKDISGLIKYVRDALCHLDSENHYIEPGNIRATYGIVHGKGVLLKVDNFEQRSDYEDDVCFFFGRHRIYLKRHVLRALKEAKQGLSPLLK